MRIGCNSNTTLVKVKYQLDILENLFKINSIQHLLKLNAISRLLSNPRINSNTTLVKVKYGKRIYYVHQLEFKYNTC